ncbi:hypothetical protein [Cryobacterium arcticum]|uniref:DUF5134 domain-containing protein n=1 Tax=Cryobacterium arcticum TaxID=670052 RepID=A0A317ZLN7_9MICO|nr:hypothetical protein [Cryobacterium arcticum]PXA67336.1 hypothetical protein CTB96_11365 [Cryobacterium arcticum]
MISALHLIMIVAAATSLCCVLGSRRTRSVTAVGGTVLMVAAMADLAFGLVGLPPLGWTGILLGWAMVAAGAARWRERRTEAHVVSSASASPGGIPADAAAVADRRHLHLLHQLGLVVVAGQIALCSAMTGGSATGGQGAGGSGAMAGLTHPHSVSIFVAVVCVAGALFVLAAAAMVLVGRRSRSERGNLLSMSVMTAAMAVMPFG